MNSVPASASDIILVQNIPTDITRRLLDKAYPGLACTCLEDFETALKMTLPNRRQLVFVASSHYSGLDEMATMIKGKNPKALVFSLSAMVPTLAEMAVLDGSILKLSDHEKPFRIAAEMIMAFHQGVDDQIIREMTH